MTRLKDHALAALALVLPLAAVGLFASVGLAVLGLLSLAGLVGLVGAAASRLATRFDPTSAPANA